MLTRGRGVRWHLPFRPVGLSPVFNHFSRDGGRLPRHAFPPIIPTPVSRNCGATYSRFGRIRPGKRTPERYAAILVASCGVEPLSCGSKPPALPLSYLAVYVRFPLRLSHPGLGGDIMISHSQGSFQWDSAGAGHSCHRFRLHDRRASCPFSGAVRRSRLPGIVSLHSHLPHGGRDPPPSLSGGFQPCSVGARYYRLGAGR